MTTEVKFKEEWAEKIREASSLSTAAAKEVFGEFRSALESGQLRAAEFIPNTSSPANTSTNEKGKWVVNSFVKEGILLGFRTGVLTQVGTSDNSRQGGQIFFDKDTMELRQFALADGIRIVPGGTSVRRGAYLARGVTIMPPAYVNIGAYVDSDSMIDSHALVGSCAQIGKRVHLSASAQIGGVLEPIGALPVIVEDDVMIGGNCGIYEGVIVSRGAVIATGTILNGSTALFDIVEGKILRSKPNQPLIVPPRAVVVPGVRLLSGEFAREHGLGLQTPIIIKYRDDKTDARTALEGALRHGPF